MSISMQSTGVLDPSAVASYYRELLERRPAPGRAGELLDGREGVVLVGAGAVGQQFLAALRQADIPVFTFADNGRQKWGTSVAGVGVISVDQAVRQFGNRAVYVITIGRIGPGVSALREQLRGLGATPVLHFIDAIRRVPAVWHGFFLDPAQFRADAADRCAAAYRLLADDESRRLFLSHLRWRTTIDPSELPIPSYDNQYFVEGVVTPRHCASFVDVGGYIGDTLAMLLEFAGPSLREYHGYEPDAANYARLEATARQAAAERPGARFVTGHLAVGAEEGTLFFSNDGAATSHIVDGRGTSVRCARLDDLDVGPPSYVKIDVEGAEDAVLRGADDTLRAARPTIAIASYHRPADLFELPLRLAEYAPDYRFHFRSHGDAGVDLVCYAVRP